tara:strand:- start:132 stop:368 length:237 start_codon:yes stop_codon:yes gene_type:complete
MSGQHLPQLKVGDLVTGPFGFGAVGMLKRIYDQDTGQDATIEDAKTKLLAAAVVSAANGAESYCLVHELEPLKGERLI